MKILQIIVGLLFLTLAATCPLPPMLAIPGVAWRCGISLLGCAAAISGISGLTKKAREGAEK